MKEEEYLGGSNTIDKRPGNKGIHYWTRHWK